jgi:WD repeat-containing protein 23
MESGDFGTNETQAVNTIGQKKKLARRILNRELGMSSGARHKANQNLMAQGMIPSSKADTIIHYDAPVYSGQFSDDGNFFFACVKDLKVRMYDTSNPVRLPIYLMVGQP